MPTIFYSENEYHTLQRAATRLSEQVEVLEQLRPVWACGSAQASVVALSSIWRELGAKNQTEAMQALRKLKEK